MGEACPLACHSATWAFRRSRQPIRPFTPNRKANMSAWMAVHCDPEDYGKAVVYQFPQTTLTEGPAQVEARAASDGKRDPSHWSCGG